MPIYKLLIYIINTYEYIFQYLHSFANATRVAYLGGKYRGFDPIFGLSTIYEFVNAEFGWRKWATQLQRGVTGDLILFPAIDGGFCKRLEEWI